MARKRQTRRQKIVASTRRNMLENIIEILPASPAQQPASILAPVIKNYSYVIEDARKTFFTIIVIAALNIIFFFLLKFELINLFGIAF
jgi:hypothetical protein